MEWLFPPIPEWFKIILMAVLGATSTILIIRHIQWSFKRQVDAAERRIMAELKKHLSGQKSAFDKLADQEARLNEEMRPLAGGDLTMVDEKE